MQATFVYYKAGFEKELFVHQSEGTEACPLTKLSTKSYESQLDAMTDFDARLGKVTNSKRILYTILMHTSEEIEHAERVFWVMSPAPGCFDTITVDNPFYRNSIKPKRNVSIKETTFAMNGTMHSQLFGMLEKTAYDQKLLARYQLDDIQVDNIYGFQQDNFEPISSMSRVQVVRLVRDVLSYIKLPWISIYFMPDGDAAFFKLAMSDGDDHTPDDDYEDSAEQKVLPLDDNVSANPLLQPINMEMPEAITINKLSLHLPETWAMNKDTVLHELSHYICFMLGLNVPFYNDKTKYDNDLFTLIFSSHGKLFCTIFAQLLIKFCYLKKDALYTTLDKHGVCYYKIERLDEAALYKSIKAEFDDAPAHLVE
tara:strand:+ start:868 stop:1974 length:1107 start_codon:yes stop_codon:yes gene_type:complete